jgi:hypothetical protein
MNGAMGSVDVFLFLLLAPGICKGLWITVERQVCIIDCVFLALLPCGLVTSGPNHCTSFGVRHAWHRKGWLPVFFFFLHIIIGVGDTTLARVS